MQNTQMDVQIFHLIYYACFGTVSIALMNKHSAHLNDNRLVAHDKIKS